MLTDIHLSWRSNCLYGQLICRCSEHLAWCWTSYCGVELGSHLNSNEDKWMRVCLFSWSGHWGQLVCAVYCCPGIRITVETTSILQMRLPEPAHSVPDTFTSIPLQWEQNFVLPVVVLLHDWASPLRHWETLQRNEQRCERMAVKLWWKRLWFF
jgi:hypothetical protein